MGLTDKHLAYGDDIPQTQTEKDYYWKIKHLEEQNNKLKEAYDIAIETLEQKPCEDCISRSGALSVFRPRGITEDVWKECDVYKKLTALPSVTPKKKTGKWIDDYKNEIDDEHECSKHFYRCSECGKYADQFVDGIEDLWDTEKPNFCPNCGAKMVESQESEDTDGNS